MALSPHLIVDVTQNTVSQRGPTASEQTSSDAALVDQQVIQQATEASEQVEASQLNTVRLARATLQTVIDTPNNALTAAMRDNALRMLCRFALVVYDRLTRRGIL